MNSEQDQDHACAWTRRYAELADDLREMKRDLRSLQGQVKAADMRNKKMAENCNFNDGGLCEADNRMPCRMQCGEKGVTLHRDKGILV